MRRPRPWSSKIQLCTPVTGKCCTFSLARRQSPVMPELSNIRSGHYIGPLKDSPEGSWNQFQSNLTFAYSVIRTEKALIDWRAWLTNRAVYHKLILFLSSSLTNQENVRGRWPWLYQVVAIGAQNPEGKCRVTTGQHIAHNECERCVWIWMLMHLGKGHLEYLCPLSLFRVWTTHISRDKRPPSKRGSRGQLCVCIPLSPLRFLGWERSF